MQPNYSSRTPISADQARMTALNPVYTGIGHYERIVDDSIWIKNSILALRHAEENPDTYMNVVERCILASFGQAGYVAALPTILQTKSALRRYDMHTDQQIEAALSDLLTDLRQVLSQA